MRTVRVLISGTGGVGMKLAETLLDRSDGYYRQRFGVDVRLVGVCSSTSGIVREEGLTRELLADRAQWQAGLSGTRWLDAGEADVLVEAGPSDYQTGGPGLGYLRGALERGMHGIAISKGALVLHGRQLQSLAHQHGCKLYAGAAGAAGMPLIDFLSYDLAGAEVTKVEAVLTGTAAYVLDGAVRHGQSLDEALAEARNLGIAEADPSFDLDGWDSAAKLVIIAGMVFDKWISLDEISRVSVREVTNDQLFRWRETGTKVALVGQLMQCDSELTASVALREFEAGHPYAASTGSEKGAFIETTQLGAYSLIGGASSVAATVAAALKDLDHLLRAVI